MGFLAGFLRDKVCQSPSMVRLVSLILAIDVTAIVAILGWLALRPSPDAVVLGVLAGVITTLAGIVWGGLRTRSPVTPAPQEPAADE